MAAETHVENGTVETTDEKPKRKLKQTVLDNFSKITHVNEKIRVKSGVNLLSYLSESVDKEKEENEVKYALGRLIRGLGSSTNQARGGFFTALTGLLCVRQEVSVSEVFEYVEKHLHKTGNNTKGENADICSGQVLVCGAIIHSDLYNRSQPEEQKKVIETLLTAGKERVYLTLVSYIFLTELVDKSSDKDVQKTILPLLKADLTKPITDYTLDSLYLLLALEKSKPTLINSKFLKSTIGCSTVICPENLSQLSNIITALPRVTALTHPLFPLLAQNLAQSDQLVDFFGELDQHLHRPNRNKHLAFIQLFTFILSDLKDFDKIPQLFTENFVRQTVAYFKSFSKNQNDGEFQKQAHLLFEKLLEVLKGAQVPGVVKIGVLKRLLFNPGTFIFEKVTKSKIIQNITHTLDCDGVKELAAVYCDVVTGKLRIDVGANTNEAWLNNDRLYAAHLMVKLLHLQVVNKENTWKADKLGFLLNLGLFQGANVGVELASALKLAFYNALDLKSCKLEDCQVILGQLVQLVDGKLEGGELRSPIGPDHLEVWRKTVQLIGKLERKKKRAHGVKSVFLTLFLHMALQLLNDPKLAMETLQELFSCYERVRKTRTNSGADLDETAPDLEANDPLWIEVVVDLFLNLLSHNSHLLRSLVANVFPHLCPYLNATAVHQILNVLDTSNDDNPLSKNQDESDDESDGEEEEESSSDDEDDEEDVEDEEDNEDDEEEEKVSDKLRMALHQVLSANQPEDDQESINLDDLSDSEGQKLDAALADAFKQFRPNRGKSRRQNKDAETLTHFRIRALDLIEIYLDSTPNMLLTLEIMLPLLQAVEFSIRDEHQKPLHNRLKAILKKLTGTKKFDSTEGVDDTILNDLLKSLLEKGTKNSLIIQEMGDQIAECCIFIVKCSQTIVTVEETPKKVKKHLKKNIPEVIKDELTHFMNKRDCLTPYVLFKNILNLNWDGCLTLATTLLPLVYSDIKAFKKTQALELLKIFFSNQRYLSSNPEKHQLKLEEPMRAFLDQTNEFFTKLCENQANQPKERFLTHLFQVLNSIKSCPIKLEVDWKQLGENVREYRTHVSFSKDAKTAFNKLCNSLGVPHVVKMKANVTKLSNNSNNNEEDDKENDDAPEPSKVEKKNRKQKANKEKLKLKKEAKALRLQSLSEGLVDTVDAYEKYGLQEDMDVEDNEEQNTNESAGESGDENVAKTTTKKAQTNRKRKSKEVTTTAKAKKIKAKQ